MHFFSNSSKYSKNKVKLMITHIKLSNATQYYDFRDKFDNIKKHVFSQSQSSTKKVSHASFFI